MKTTTPSIDEIRAEIDRTILSLRAQGETAREERMMIVREYLFTPGAKEQLGGMAWSLMNYEGAV